MFTIGTFNVNSIRTRMPLLEKWLLEKQPDIVCFQETKVIDEDFPAADLEKLGYNVVCRGQKAYNGVAIISKKPFTEIIYPVTDFCLESDARLLAIRIGDINIINSYIPQGQSTESEKFQYKLNWIKGMGEWLEQEGYLREKTLWLGDFNVALEDIDVYDPKNLRGSVCFNPLEQEALLGVMAKGFIDIFRKHVKKDGEFTFWDYRLRGGVSRNLGWRIDHIWATGEIASFSRNSWVDKEIRSWEKPSDHAPLLATFDMDL